MCRGGAFVFTWVVVLRVLGVRARSRTGGYGDLGWWGRGCFRETALYISTTI